MATRNTTAAQAAIQSHTGRKAVREVRQPDAYLNCELVGKDGKTRYSLGRNNGLPLFTGTDVGDAIMAAAEANPDREFTLVARVHIVNGEPVKVEL